MLLVEFLAFEVVLFLLMTLSVADVDTVPSPPFLVAVFVTSDDAGILPLNDDSAGDDLANTSRCFVSSSSSEEDDDELDIDIDGDER